MVRSKRKWKKDSPEKLISRIEKGIEKANEVRLSKPKITSPEITSPENKKSRGPKSLSTDSSSGISPEASLITADPNLSVQIDQEIIMDPEAIDPVVSNEDKVETLPEEKMSIEDTLKSITHSLATLTSSVLTINSNMVSKSDLSEMKRSVEANEKQITENTESLKGKASKEEVTLLKKKLNDHDKILKAHDESMEKISADISTLTKNQETTDKEKCNISNRIDGLAGAHAKSNLDLQKEIEDLKARVSNHNAEITSLRNGQSVINRPPTHSMAGSLDFPPVPQQPRLNVIIEGLDENEDEDLVSKVLSFCEKLGVKLDSADFSSVSWLKRKVPIGKNPNPVKVCFLNVSVKERVMRVKYKLNLYPETKGIWVNHDEPVEVRRAKGRARFIASFSRKKGASVQLTQRGIILDSVFYGYDNLSKIPSIYIPPKTLTVPQTVPLNRSAEPMEVAAQYQPTRDGGGSTTEARRPIGPNHTLQDDLVQAQQNMSQSPKTPRTKKKQKMRLTTSGLVYSRPSAILSHLYKVRIVIENTPYNSVEQRLQSQKAILAGDKQAEDDIMKIHDTWEIKRRGDRVKVTKEYIDKRLDIAGSANEAKFQQNLDLMDFLLETEDLILIEGATSSFWAGGESFDSEAYDNGDAHGKNSQGKLVMTTRENERRKRAMTAI